MSTALAWQNGYVRNFSVLGITMGYFFPNGPVNKAQLVLTGIDRGNQFGPFFTIMSWYWDGGSWARQTSNNQQPLSVPTPIPPTAPRTTKLATFLPLVAGRQAQFLVTAPHDGAPPILWWYPDGAPLFRSDRQPSGWINRPKILDVIIDDIDGDGFDEVVYLWNYTGALGIDIYKYESNQLTLKKSYVDPQAPGAAVWTRALSTSWITSPPTCHFVWGLGTR